MGKLRRLYNMILNFLSYLQYKLKLKKLDWRRDFSPVESGHILSMNMEKFFKDLKDRTGLGREDYTLMYLYQKQDYFIGTKEESFGDCITYILLPIGPTAEERKEFELYHPGEKIELPPSLIVFDWSRKNEVEFTIFSENLFK